MVNSPASLGRSETRRSMNMIIGAWVFGSAWMYITTGAALTRYAKLMGLPAFGFGLLAALPFAGALLQLPSSYCVARYGGRKSLLLVAGFIRRALWFAVAAVPYVLPRSWWWPTLLGCLTLSSFAGHAATPPVLSWFADTVPARVRGRYFSRRLQVGQFVGLATTLAVGYVLDQVGALDETGLRRTIAATFVIAGIAGVLDFVVLIFVPDAKHRPDPSLSLWGMLRGPLRDRSFRCYLGYNATMMLALGYVGQFIWLYVFDVVGLNNTHANLMLVAVPLTGILKVSSQTVYEGIKGYRTQ